MRALSKPSFSERVSTASRVRTRKYLAPRGYSTNTSSERIHHFLRFHDSSQWHSNGDRADTFDRCRALGFRTSKSNPQMKRWQFGQSTGPRSIPADDPPDVVRMRQILLTSLRYNVPWLDKTYPPTPDGHSCVVTLPESGKKHEHIIRPAASVTYGIVIAMKTGDVNEAIVGESRRMSQLGPSNNPRNHSCCHTANVTQTKDAAPKNPAWGDHWQSAHSSAHLATAAWMIWNDLDHDTQQLVVRMVTHEANRFMSLATNHIFGRLAKRSSPPATPALKKTPGIR